MTYRENFKINKKIFKSLYDTEVFEKRTLFNPMSNSFNYKKFIESLGEQAWKIEVINIFRCFDTDREGALPKDTAIHALSLLGIKDEKLFRGSKDVVTAKSFACLVVVAGTSRYRRGGC